MMRRSNRKRTAKRSIEPEYTTEPKRRRKPIQAASHPPPAAATAPIELPVAVTAIKEEVSDDPTRCRTCLKPCWATKTAIEGNLLGDVNTLFETHIGTLSPEGDGLSSMLCSECVKRATDAASFVRMGLGSFEILYKGKIKTEPADESTEEPVPPQVSYPDEPSLDESLPAIKMEVEEPEEIDVGHETVPRTVEQAPVLNTLINSLAVESKITLLPTKSQSRQSNSTSSPPVRVTTKVTGYIPAAAVGSPPLHIISKVQRAEPATSSASRSPSPNLDMSAINGDGPYTCPKCKEEFTKRTLFEKHLRGHNAVKCKICGDKFLSKSSMKVHMTRHEGQEVPCKECGKCYNAKSLEYHWLREHQPKPHKCKLCPSTFTKSNSLSRHMKDCHSKKKHTCDVCGKMYATHESIKKHMYLHTNNGKLPYPCGVGVCKRQFGMTCRRRLHQERSHGMMRTEEERLEGAAFEDEFSSSSEPPTPPQTPSPSTLLEAIEPEIITPATADEELITDIKIEEDDGTYPSL